MADKLLQYYKYITEQKGVLGKIELAKRTVMPAIVAATEPDSTENLAKFRKAVEEITGKPAPFF